MFASGSVEGTQESGRLPSTEHFAPRSQDWAILVERKRPNTDTWIRLASGFASLSRPPDSRITLDGPYLTRERIRKETREMTSSTSGPMKKLTWPLVS